MKFPDVDGGSKGGPAAGTFLKLKDKERVKGVFVGDPVIFRQHWIENRSQLCTGKATCDHCKAGDKSKFRFRINFITKVDGVQVAKVFEQGYGFFKDLKEMHENDYNLTETLISLSRSGTGTDTEYRITPVKDNDGLKPADFKRLAAIPLNALTERDSDAIEAETNETPVESDLPF